MDIILRLPQQTCACHSIIPYVLSLCTVLGKCAQDGLSARLFVCLHAWLPDANAPRQILKIAYVTCVLTFLLARLSAARGRHFTSGQKGLVL